MKKFDESQVGENERGEIPVDDLVRLLNGEAVDVNVLNGRYRDLAQDIISSKGSCKNTLFLEKIEDWPDKDLIVRKVFAVDPNIPKDGRNGGVVEPGDDLSLLIDMPELPDAARLPDSLEREGKESGGWLDSYVEFATKASPRTDVAFHETNGLMLLSTTVARRSWIRVSSTAIYPNFYALQIASSTLHAKTSGFNVALRVGRAAGLQRFILPARLTPESLLVELTGKKPSNFEEWEKVDQDEWLAEREFSAQRVWFVEEAGNLLDSFKRDYTAGLLSIVLDLYDCPSSLTVSTMGRGRYTVRNAYLNICGPTTPASLKAHLENSLHWGNGLWARFVLVTPRSKPRWEFWPKECSIPEPLISTLNRIAHEKFPKPDEDRNFPGAVCKEDVWEFWKSYSKAVGFDLLQGDAVNGRLHANYGRLGTLAIKVALLLAVSDWADDDKSNVPIIKRRHWARAQMLVESWRLSLHRLVDSPNRDGSDDALETKVMRLLRNFSDELTSRELAQNLSMTRERERDELDKCLQRMKRDGLIEQKKRKPKRGPEADVWVLVG